MADIILLTVVGLISLSVIAFALISAYRAWISRSYRMEMKQENDAPAANNFSLGPYVAVLSSRFEESLDINSNE